MFYTKTTRNPLPTQLLTIFHIGKQFPQKSHVQNFDWRYLVGERHANPDTPPFVL